MTWCFELPAPEYLTEFTRDTVTRSAGRTASVSDTADAIADWLQEREVSDLHDRFPFVDRTKRALTALRDDAVARFPGLTVSAPAELKNGAYDSCHLEFRGIDRSCLLSFYGRNEFPEVKFYWDETKLFSFPVDDAGCFAAVLNLWLCERVMPSVLRTEFPWIEIGMLADYYEQGNPVEGEFIQSWDSIERFYRSVNLHDAVKVLEMVRQMRARGYDKTLRAGQSLFTLILSRSRRHGLRNGQPNIAFYFHRKEPLVVYANNVGRLRKITHSMIELTPEIDSLLRKLESKEVD
jgi:hypothetical protein